MTPQLMPNLGAEKWQVKGKIFPHERIKQVRFDTNG